MTARKRIIELKQQLKTERQFANDLRYGMERKVRFPIAEMDAYLDSEKRQVDICREIHQLRRPLYALMYNITSPFKRN